MRIGIGLGIDRRHGSGGGGGGGFTAQSMGNQTGEWQWYIFQGPTVDLFHGEGVYCDTSAGFNTTGNITNGSKTISGIASMANITVGMKVTGTGVTTNPDNTVLAINVPGNSVTLAYACTATTTGVALNFSFGGVQVPEAYRDSNGWPNAYPPGVTRFTTTCHGTPASEQYKLVWTGPSDATFSFGSGFTGVGSPASNSITLTPNTIAGLIGGGGANTVKWTLGTGHVTGITIRPVADPGGTFQSAFETKLGKVSSSTGPLRFMHATNAVESGSKPWDYVNIKYPVDGDNQLGRAIITSANRNTTSSADWWQWRQGIPEELYIQLCTEIARPAWYCVPWNIDGTNADGSTYTSTFLTDIAAKFATFSQTTGKKTFVENANEIWNFSYLSAHQCDNEAHYYGQTAGAHTACRVVAISNITLSGTQTIDGVAVVAGDRVLVTGQTTSSQNGVYVVAAGAWSRAADTIATGDKWFITAGTTYANNSFTVWTQGTITLGTTALSIKQMLRHHRYGQKSAQVMEYFEAAFNALGIGPATPATNLLVRVAAWQNAAAATDWDEIGGFPYKTGICDDHFDMYSTAPYYNATTGANAISNTYAGPDLTTVWTALYGSVDYNLDLAAGHVTKATARGKGWGPYETGNGVGFTTQSFENTVIADTGIEGPCSYFFNEFRRRFPTSAGSYHVFIARPANESGVWNNYGLLNNVTTDETTAPLFIPFANAMLGNFTMFDPVLEGFSAVSNDAAGTVEGSFTKGLLPEATLSIIGDAAFTVDATATNGVAHLKSASGNPSAGSHTFTLRQTYNGVNHDTSYTVSVTAAYSPTSPAQPLSVWFDPSDLTSLFQDDAATTAVTADGQAVKVMKDKSGNAINAKENFGAFPTISGISAGKPYLNVSSSVNMTTQTAAVITDANGQFTVGCAIVFTNNTGIQEAIAFYTNSVLQLRNNAGTSEAISYSSAGATTTDSGATITAGTSVVLSARVTTTSVEVFVNGVSAGSTALTGTRQSGTTTIGIGQFNGGTQMTGKWYGALIYAGSLNTADMSGMNAWLAAKMP